MAEPFTDRRAAARALIINAPLSTKEGGFVGQMAFTDVVTEKQALWLDILLDRHGLPPVLGDVA